METLSKQLNAKYGKGYSVPNLQNFRKFYQIYCNRFSIRYPLGTKTPDFEKRYPLGSESQSKGFSSRLSWSHYRALMRVKQEKARNYYEQECAEAGWDKRTLERQIHSQYFERTLKNQAQHTNAKSKEVQLAPASIDSLKHPYVLEFLDLPQTPDLQELQLESAVIAQLQSFLLELGKGFAFVGRQKRLQFEDKDLFVDLVFYNCFAKCYLLIDLKMGELTHQDIGQMDGYVRLYDDQYTSSDDNPTIGLILCAEKNEAVAKYSVLQDRKQIFASKYMLYMPSEEELAAELVREQKLIGNNREEGVE